MEPEPIVSRLPIKTAGLVAVLLLLAAWLVHLNHTLLNVADRNWDFDQHYAWALQFVQGLRAGDPYPRWMPYGNLGLGEPALLYYSPLYYTAVALFSIVLPNVWDAMRAVEVAATAACGFFAWGLLRRHVGERAAVAGGIVCLATPMVFMLFHYFNGFPWASNGAWLAATLYFLSTNAQARNSRRWFSIPLVICLAGLVMTHIVSAMMVLICVSGGYILFAWGRRAQADWYVQARQWFFSAGIALCLAAVYVVPALGSTSLIASEVWTRDYTPFNAFAFPTWTTWRYGMRWFSFQWVVPLVYLAMLALAAWLARSRWSVLRSEDRAALALLLGISATAMFLASELSYPLWMVQSPLQKAQFPHRFLFVCALTCPLALVLAAYARSPVRVSARLRALVALVALASCALTVALAAKVALRDGRPVVLSDAAMAPYGSYTEYVLPTQGPRWREYLTQGGLAGECLRSGLGCRTIRAGAGGYEWQVRAGSAATLRLPVLAFPPWEFKLDGQTTAYRMDANGLIVVELPAGEHLLSLHWARLPAERVGLVVSLLTLLLLCIACGLRMRDHANRRG